MPLGNRPVTILRGTVSLFLEIKGYRMEATEEAAVIMTRDLAASEVAEEAYAKWLEDSCVKHK